MTNDTLFFLQACTSLVLYVLAFWFCWCWIRTAVEWNTLNNRDILYPASMGCGRAMDQRKRDLRNLVWYMVYYGVLVVMLNAVAGVLTPSVVPS